MQFIKWALDVSFNLGDGGDWIYIYDALNRLIQVKDSGGSTFLSLGYDPLGRLYSVDTAQSADERRYLWDGDSIIARYEGLSGSTVERRFVYAGPGALGAPLVTYEGDTVATSARRYNLTDERGSVIAIALGSNGIVDQINTYGPYGEPGAKASGEAIS